MFSKGTPVVRRRGRKKRTKELYQAVLEAYVESPGHHAHAERVTGFDRDGCKRLWDEGWPRLVWARPISMVLAEETKKGRAAAALALKRERELVDAERVKREVALRESIEEEQRMMITVRREVIAAAGVAARLTKSMLALAPIIEAALFDPVTGAPLPKPGLKPMDAVRAAKDFTTMVRTLSQASRNVVELGRLDRGQSTANIEIRDAEVDEDDLEEIAAVATLHERLADLGPEFDGGDEDIVEH